MKLIIHGGFFSESSTNLDTKIAKQKALKEIASAAYAFLASHSALETVVFAVKMLEDNPLFNAGLGSQIQQDGKVRLSASLMDGRSLKFSGVINIEHIQHPIELANALMLEEDRVLSGEGASNYAKKLGMPYFDPIISQRIAEYQAKLKSQGLGTVGCVALDADGNLAAATSTGGKGFEIPGRVSDSATVAGNYANENVAISCTGVGEDITSIGLANRISTRVDDGFSLEDACIKSFRELAKIDGFAGVIGVTSRGEMFKCDSHPYMVWASYGPDLEIFS